MVRRFLVFPVLVLSLLDANALARRRWDHVKEWVKLRAPTTYVDERITLLEGRLGQVPVALSAITSAEVLLRMPVESFLLHEDCFPAEFSRMNAGFVPSFNWSHFLPESPLSERARFSLCLLAHLLLRDASPWWPYVSYLPRAVKNGFFVSETELELLRGTNLFRAVRKNLGVLEHNLMLLEPVMQQIFRVFPRLNSTDNLFGEVFTSRVFRQRFTDTATIVQSRAFDFNANMIRQPPPTISSSSPPPSLPPFPDVHLPALIPLLDMLNHGGPGEVNCVYYWNFRKSAMELHTLRDIETGEELVMSYGPRSNAELLITYGFFLPQNVEDVVQVADLTAGALNYNLHKKLGRGDFSTVFEPLAGSGWPPPHSSSASSASSFCPAPSAASSSNSSPVFGSSGSLGCRSNNWVDGSDDGEREVVWCNHLAPEVNSVSVMLAMLEQGAFPRIGQCRIFSRRFRLFYRIRRSRSSRGTWEAVLDREANNKTEAGLRQHIVSLANLEQFTSQVSVHNLDSRTLMAVRLAVLHPLSAFMVHRVLSGLPLDPEQELQVKETLLVFCVDELSRRLESVGVHSQRTDLSRDVLAGADSACGESSPACVEWRCRTLIDHAAAQSDHELVGTAESVARGELAVLASFFFAVISDMKFGSPNP